MSHPDNPPYFTTQHGPCDAMWHVILVVYDPVGDGYIVSETYGDYITQMDAEEDGRRRAEHKGWEFKP